MAEAESDDSRHRAKVYCLNSNGQWDDRGTGHAAVQYSPVRTLSPRGDPGRGVAAASRLLAVLVGRARVGSWLCSSAAAAGAAILAHARRSRAQEDEAAFVVVVSEDDGSQVLLQARVHMEDIYQRQQGAALSCRRRRTLPLCTDRVPSACAAETIVSWNEPETGVDYALSFQDVRASPDASSRTATLSAWPIDSLALGAGPLITCGACKSGGGLHGPLGANLLAAGP